MDITYSASVDPDVRFSQNDFVRDLQIYLADPDGWEGKGYRFHLVKKNAKITIRLSSPATIKARCGDGNLSCAELGGTHMFLNSMRWMHGAKESKLPLEEYRQYMVSHEMGHILGHDHVKCPGPGKPAPIMMQQTLGIGECSPNTRV